LIIIILLLITTLFLVIGQVKGADIYIALIKGFMLGALFHKEQYDDGYDEYTLQCVIGFINVTVKWEQQAG
jgi:hypothetical protein|tara:strand:+ start:3915 stop:4127 length:213 start_codon:yes stop_codon:yes gene_type:complete